MSGTICIMDSGIDYEHPDLQGTLYNFEENLPAERYAELKAKYGMGKYGLNTSDSGRTDDVFPTSLMARMLPASPHPSGTTLVRPA